MALPSTSTFTALDAVREAGITIASDGAEYNKIGEFNPVDATTNPSLVYAAVLSPQYFFLVEEAVDYAYKRIPLGSVQEKTDLALDYLLVQVGAKILSIIPGRVSISVDPRLGFSYEAILRKSRSLIALAEELHIPRSRVLIKIPATSAGIRAAQVLESQDGVHTNMTLIFSLVQAIACAQAGATVISPFIGRVKDWWVARAEAEGNPGALANQPLSEHPGIKLVHRIREAFRRFGYDTQIMAAGFRKPEEIVEVSRAGRKGGVDLVTLPPDLLDGLRRLQGENFDDSFQPSSYVTASLPSSAPTYFTRDGPTEDELAAFDRDSKAEAISLDKVPEGLEKFSADTTKLENLVKNLVEAEDKVRSLKSSASSAQQNAMAEGRRTVHVL